MSALEDLYEEIKEALFETQRLKEQNAALAHRLKQVEHDRDDALAVVARLAAWLDHIGSVACTYKTCDEYCQEICRMLACAKRGEKAP